MKILLLAGVSSVHAIRWANALQENGHEVHVITQHKPRDKINAEVTMYYFPFMGALGYFLMVPYVKRLIAKIHPDIISAHYASGYATTARLVGFKPWVLSVWGSDVYLFPYKSFLHKNIVKKNLLAANGIASTGHSMAEQIRSLIGNQEIHITPFGVDMAVYEKIKQRHGNGEIVVGTIKTMAPVYGIDVLLRSFALVVERLINSHASDLNITLRLVGGGGQTVELKKLAKLLGIEDRVVFVGQVPHEQVPSELEKIDIFVALSHSESFGVSIIEAGAASRPVVVTNVGGLPEVVIEGETGFVVEKNNPYAASIAIEKLILDSKLRKLMGENARAHVAANYSWPICVNKMNEFLLSAV